MKRPIDYRPKFSLSIFYLRQIMTTTEFNTLLEKYIAKKLEYWNERGNKKIS